MKHANPNQAGKSITCVDMPKKLMGPWDKPASEVEVVIAEIRQRAEYVGSVLEDILQADHASLNLGKLA